VKIAWIDLVQDKAHYLFW